MPFGIVDWTGPGIRQIMGFGNWSAGRSTFGGEFVARHCPQGPTGRTCATAPRRGPLVKLLWADLLHISSCNTHLNKIFNFVSLSYASAGPGREREWKLRERDRSGIDHCGTGTGMGMTAAGTGRDREQCTSPVQNSSQLTVCLLSNNVSADT